MNKNPITTYISWLVNIMKKGGFAVVSAVSFTIIPYTILFKVGLNSFAIIWFLIGTPISASFIAFYFTEYKNETRR